MKNTKFFFYLAVTGVMAIAACKGGKPDDKVLAEMSQFEADWGKAASDLKGWEATLSAAMTATKSCLDSSCGEGAVCKKGSEGKCDTLKASCKTIQADLEAAKEEYTKAVAANEADGRAWTEWAEKAKKGEVEAADLTKAMDDWNRKLNDLKSNMTKWDDGVKALTEKCKANCLDMKAYCETGKKP
ncbi:MAG: hypothetical protein EXR21_07860 [Flavobacteriaceae bacterium]|nr:hypothetical protein [Flavobacteriaceae bacterium]